SYDCDKSLPINFVVGYIIIFNEGAFVVATKRLCQIYRRCLVWHNIDGAFYLLGFCPKMKCYDIPCAKC
ncbi:hypothetical protein, partial [Klebsiella variicola]|uniref:hypothetical protein n=1 Tax=Klebsiella variicola TaxID=244366 RepID=UPI001E4BB264